MVKKKERDKKEDLMFGKDGEGMIVEGKMNSIIGKGCSFKGTVDVKEGTLRIDGDFEGTVNCPDTLIVGKGGKVKAEIKVKSAVIGGTVLGNIDANEKIELQAGSRLEGDIKTTRLVIDEGVFFEGSCKMSPDRGMSSGSSSVSSSSAQSQDEKKPVHSGTK
jgi:cytoskeletal protein CcmA (bactofilin family)